jgi:Domain of unknown function (DUF4158)
MQSWQATYLGMRELPREFSAFELQAFFAFSRSERELIDARRGAALKLGLALHIGFLRMSGRLLDAFRVVPPVLWRQLRQSPLATSWAPRFEYLRSRSVPRIFAARP